MDPNSPPPKNSEKMLIPRSEKCLKKNLGTCPKNFCKRARQVKWECPNGNVLSVCIWLAAEKFSFIPAINGFCETVLTKSPSLKEKLKL